MTKKHKKSFGVKAAGSGQSAENKTDFNIYRPYWSTIKFDAITGITKGKVIKW